MEKEIKKLIKKYDIDLYEEGIKGALDIVDNRQYSLVSDYGEVWDELEQLRAYLYLQYVIEYDKKTGKNMLKEMGYVKR